MNDTETECDKDALENNVTKDTDTSLNRSSPSTESYKTKFQRSQRRAYTFSQHGGLEGCLRLANADRIQRTEFSKLSDENIKTEHQRQRVRDILKDIGLQVDEAALSRAGTTNFYNWSSFSTSVGSTAETIGSELSSRHSTLENDSDPFVNHRRDDRRSSLRFYTVDPNNAAIQERLESLLQSYVKK